MFTSSPKELPFTKPFLTWPETTVSRQSRASFPDGGGVSEGPGLPENLRGAFVPSWPRCGADGAVERDQAAATELTMGRRWECLALVVQGGFGPWGRASLGIGLRWWWPGADFLGLWQPKIPLWALLGSWLPWVSRS